MDICVRTAGNAISQRPLNFSDATLESNPNIPPEDVVVVDDDDDGEGVVDDKDDDDDVKYRTFIALLHLYSLSFILFCNIRIVSCTLDIFDLIDLNFNTFLNII